MTDRKLGSRVLLLATVVIGAGLLLPQVESYGWYGGAGEYEWVETAAAQARTQDGDCGPPGDPNSGRCLEMCIRGQDGGVEPQGVFECEYD